MKIFFTFKQQYGRCYPFDTAKLPRYRRIKAVNKMVIDISK
ncbi:hypothetical protein A4U88_3515 [Serratia marcescens]|nr:hypothetical protein A4U88_3515 [Serratia marcescens]